jgi:signal transduction histidine kinase
MVVSESRQVTIVFIDNGTGIKKSEIKQVFKPFYTTKSRQKNWGAGLSYVMNIVRAHLGLVNVYSRYGEYTRFEIILNIVRGGVIMRILLICVTLCFRLPTDY